MSQLHNEGLRKQLVADKRTGIADLSWLVSLEPLQRPILLHFCKSAFFMASLVNWLFRYLTSIT